MSTANCTYLASESPERRDRDLKRSERYCWKWNIAIKYSGFVGAFMNISYSRAFNWHKSTSMNSPEGRIHWCHNPNLHSGAIERAKTDEKTRTKPYSSMETGLGQNWLSPFEYIPVRPKPTSSSPSHSIPFRPKLNFSIPISPKLTFSITIYSSQANIVNKSSFLFLPCRSWSPNYSVLVKIAKLFFLVFEYL
jgi:hypothetical protein